MVEKRGSATAPPGASGFAGSVPDQMLMRRVAQIGDGKIFGSLGFATETAFALRDRFSARSVVAREVGELGYATHGWRLAKGNAAGAAGEKGAVA